MYSARQYVTLYTVFLGSMFAGASVVHSLLKPDLTLPGAPAAGAAAAAPATVATGPAAAAAGGAPAAAAPVGSDSADAPQQSRQPLR